MATVGTSGNQSTTLMQGLDGELICAVCLELFNTPIMLPCSHNFCQQCIFSIVETGMSFSYISIGPPTSFNCPICQAVININRLNESGLIENIALANIVSLYKSCAPVDIFDSAWNGDLEVTPGMCPEHEKPLDRFCDSCSITVCTECEIIKHQSAKAKHRVESLKYAVVSYQTEIADILTDLKKKMIPLNDRVHQLEDTVRTIQDNKESNGKRLEQNMSALMSHLRQRQEGLKRILENEMQASQRPVIAELERCLEIKRNVQELMKKLSQVHHIKNANLKLKLMKDMCKQLTTVLCFDIDVCLQNPHLADASIPVLDLNFKEVLDAVGILDWKHSSQGSEKTKCKETSVQTEIEELNLNILPGKLLPSDLYKQTKGNNCDKLTAYRRNSGQSTPSPRLKEDHVDPGPRSPEQTKLDSRSFDEIDGDYPNCGITVPLSVENLTKNDDEIRVTEKRRRNLNLETESLKENGFVEKAQNHVPDGDVNEDLNEQFKGLEITSRSGIKGRSSFPMESDPVIGNKNANGKQKISVNNTKKSYSDKDLNIGEHAYSPSNAEVLAKFVARRRTMSPSMSSPTLQELEGTLSDPTRKKASSTALKSLNKSFTQTNSKPDQDLSRSLPTLSTEEVLLTGKDGKQIQDVAKSDRPEKRKIEQSHTVSTHTHNTTSQSEIISSKPDITVNARLDLTMDSKPDINSQSDKKKSTPDIKNTKSDIRKTKPDKTNSQTDVVTVGELSLSPHHKPFSKQPIGTNLDFSLGLKESVGKFKLKRSTEV